MSRILGLDYGEKRIGMAISDDRKRLAVGIDTIENTDADVFLEFLKKLCQKEEIDMIVIGLPLNLSGGKTKKTIEAQQFGLKIEDALEIPVEFQDERLTSRQAEESLKGIKKDKEQIDRVSAQLILQTYLDKLRIKNK